MPKPLQPNGGNFVASTSWEKGLKVEGFFGEIVTIPNVESRKLVFDGDGKGGLFGVWETASLARYTFVPGIYYSLECTGKVKTKNGNAWSFNVLQFSEEEVAEKIGKREIAKK